LGGAVLHRPARGVDDQLGGGRRLVGRRHAGEVGDLAGVRASVEAFRVARLARRAVGAASRSAAFGETSATIAIAPLSANSPATSPTRRTFSRRSSAEKPRSPF